VSYSKRKALKKILGSLLVLVLIGTSPGVFEGIKAFAEPPVANTVNQEIIATASELINNEQTADNPFAVNSDVKIDKDAQPVVATETEAVKTTKAEIDEAAKKKEMGRIEKVAWTIGKALLPTLAVMTFCAAVACPLAWVVVGSVLIGAATAGITTFAYEKRMNQFREEGKKKSTDKILRAVTVSAAVEGAMAPFTMLTAGFVKAIGPVTVKTVLATAAKVGVTQFAGNTISNVAKGTVTNLWYDNYYNYDEEEEKLKKELALIENKHSPSPEEEVRFVEIKQRLDQLEKEKYTWEKFKSDERKAAVSAGISGVLGGAASKLAANTAWAKIASSKIFGSTKNAGMVANAVVSNPFAFMSGSSNALLQKREMSLEIKKCKKLQAQYDEGTPAYSYYEEKIAGLEKAREGIDLVAAGTNSMINNLAIQSAAMTVAVGKARLWDLPHARRNKINEKYRAQDEAWQKAEQTKAKMDAFKAKAPRREDFSSRAEYLKEVWKHHRLSVKYEKLYKARKVKAVDAEKSLENKAIKSQIEAQVDAEITLQRKLDLAKSLGDKAYLKFKMDEIKKRMAADGKSVDDKTLRAKAIDEYKSEASAAAQKSAEKLADMEKKLMLEDDSKDLKGKVITGEDGKRYVVLEDSKGVERLRREVTQPKETWYSKYFDRNPTKLEARELTKAFKIANAGGAQVKPSVYRATYVEMKVNELRSKGLSTAQINDQIFDVFEEANKAMLGTFGGSWQEVVQAEMVAAGLAKAKYSNGEAPDFEDIYNTIEKTSQTKIISEFQKELNNQAKAYTLTPIKTQLKDKKMGKFAEKYVNTVLDKSYNEAIKKTTDAKVKEVYTNTSNTVKDVTSEISEEIRHDYDPEDEESESQQPETDADEEPVEEQEPEEAETPADSSDE
jgi:hypothetical protein